MTGSVQKLLVVFGAGLLKRRERLSLIPILLGMVVPTYNPNTQRLRQEDSKFETTIGCSVRPCHKQIKNLGSSFPKSSHPTPDWS